MIKYSPYEKKIWQKGFFVGISIAKMKYGAVALEAELAKAKENISIFLDKNYEIYSLKLKKMYRRKLHLSKRFIERYNDDLRLYRTIIEFCAFCKSVGLDAFLDFLKDSSYFEQLLFKIEDQEKE